MANRWSHERRLIAVLIAVFVSAQFLILSARSFMVSEMPIGATLRRLIVHLGLAGICFLLGKAVYATRRLGLAQRAIAAVAAALLAALAQEAFNDILFYWLFPSGSGEYDIFVFLNGALFWFWFLTAWAGMYLAASYSLDVRDRERRLAQLGTLAREAELRALRYQINPHFLFNSLNSIASLISDDKSSNAEAMIVALADFYRAGLICDARELVPLSRELELQRKYLEVESLRFEDRLEVQFDVPESAMGALVPNLILQPLVENAIRHGVAASLEPTRVAISADLAGRTLKLVIQNTRHDGSSMNFGTGTGLVNVKARLRSAFGEAARLDHGPHGLVYEATLTLPLIELDSEGELPS